MTYENLSSDVIIMFIGAKAYRSVECRIDLILNRQLGICDIMEILSCLAIIQATYPRTLVKLVFQRAKVIQRTQFKTKDSFVLANFKQICFISGPGFSLN